MIDQLKITNYNRTTSELEEFILFCVSVPGHNALTTSKALARFLKDTTTPFQFIRDNRTIVYELLVAAKMGCGTMRARTYLELADSNLDLKKCLVDELEAIWGVGLKTSRFFLLHSRKNAQIACLDRHILKWLKDNGYEAPEKPTKSSYKTWEKIFLDECEKRGQTPAELDLEIWTRYSRWTKEL